ncbi:MAG: hypothetical protein JG718_06470 [Candidatus Thiothrix moscowensis]|nr:hypothetical protein [Candidatus Thiothrix moscowensis]
MVGLEGKMFASNSDALEYSEWMVERVERSMLVLSGAIGARREDGRASIRDSDLDGMLCLLADTLKDARAIMMQVNNSLINE